jgi:hypothetical protein
MENEGQINNATMKLILKVMKVAPRKKIEILRYLEFTTIIRMSLELEMDCRIRAYRLISKGIRTKSAIIGMMIESGLFDRLPDELKLGNYTLRNAVMKLVSRTLKYSKICSSAKNQASFPFQIARTGPQRYHIMYS